MRKLQAGDSADNTRDVGKSLETMTEIVNGDSQLYQKSKRKFVEEFVISSGVEIKKKSDLIRVFVKGGIMSPADLLKIMDISRSLGNKYVLFGSRQDIMFPSNGTDEATIERYFRPLTTAYELG